MANTNNANLTVCEASPDTACHHTVLAVAAVWPCCRPDHEPPFACHQLSGAARHLLARLWMTLASSSHSRNMYVTDCANIKHVL